MIRYIQKVVRHPKILSLFFSMAIFSILYLILDDEHFSGVNYIKEKIKEEVIKKEVEKKVDQNERSEPFTGFNYNHIDKQLERTTEEVKQEIKETEFVSNKIDVSIYQNSLIVFIFLFLQELSSVTAISIPLPMFVNLLP